MRNTAQHRNWISRIQRAAADAALVLAVGLALAAITTQPAQAQTFNLLYSFCAESGCPDGWTPYAGLVQGTDGNLYGTTVEGETCVVSTGANCGTVFSITTSGTLTNLYTFCSKSDCADGVLPLAGLVLATDGNLYGTTFNGGASGSSCPYYDGCGTVFKITETGTLTTLYSFCSQSGCADGEGPQGALTQATDGSFYGTTLSGGAYGSGTVFKITSTGTLTTLYSFCENVNPCVDGEEPTAGLVQATDGNFYGTTYAGTAYRGGTVFKITPTGVLTTLYMFCSNDGGNPSDCADGENPSAGLVQGTDGNFYGTTFYGGQGGACPRADTDGCGTVFKMTPNGTLTKLYAFSGADGENPQAGLIQATDGNLYGTTVFGGGFCWGTEGTCGTIFEITTNGTLTTLHSFSGPDGGFPDAALVQDTNGSFYGTTFDGGAYSTCNPQPSNIDCGNIFSLDNFLGPFVKTVSTSGPVKTAVMILGTDLTGATSVSFNGTAATFTVVSASLITTTVPTGATTGPVTVITPSGTLTSNVPFTITTGGNTASTTTLVSSLNPSTYGQSVTFTATVTGADGGTPTGTVTFTADGSNVLGMITLSGGQAAVSTSALTAGTHSIVASYGGDSNYQPSTSTPLIQTVQMASSSVALASNLNPSAYNQAVTFTASISPQFGGKATGIVTFYSNAVAVGGATVGGNKATLTINTLAVGTDNIQATYSGDSNVAGSSSPALPQVVKKASTTTGVTSSLNPAFVGQPITFTATVTSRYQGMVSGTVDFKSGAASLGWATLVNGQASIETSFSKSGSDSITAKYLGDANDTGSTSPALKQAVNKYPSSTTLTSSLNPSMVGQEVTFTATVTTGATGTVTFKSGATILGKVSLTGNTASLSTSSLAVGSYNINAVYSGDGTFKGSTSPVLKQVVNQP